MSRSARRKVAEISSHQDKKETALKLTKVVKTSAKAYPIGAKQLARYWGIGLNKDNKTIEVTIQNGVRTLLHPTLSRRFRTDDRQLW